MSRGLVNTSYTICNEINLCRFCINFYKSGVLDTDYYATEYYDIEAVVVMVL
jgi:hypothetical protein